MMIQPSPDGEPRFVIKMTEHNDFCDQIARAFGNDEFERPEPFDEVIYAISHHDWGWNEYDAEPIFDATSGYPCGLGTVPVPGGMDTSSRSPDINEAHHAYSGLLSSMHSWGLYNARYGFTAFAIQPGGPTSVVRPPAIKQAADAMLESELTRQEKLKAILAADPETAGWIEEKRLFANYKLLQFCDTVALYFNLRHAATHGEEVYIHVPKSPDEDATVTLEPLGGGRYRLTPFPFAGDELELRCDGRYFKAVADAPDDFAEVLYGQPAAQQVFTLVAG